MSDNQAATVDESKDRDEFLQILEAGLGECKWRSNNYDEENDCEVWFGDRENKSAKFKVFAFKSGARWEFIAEFSPYKIKSDFKKKLENADWQGTDEIKWTGKSGRSNAHISKNIGEKKYEFVVGISGKAGKDISQDQAEKFGYFCIKPVIDGIRQGTPRPFDKAITDFNKFSEDIKDSGIDQIFDNFFREEDEEKSGRAKKSSKESKGNKVKNDNTDSSQDSRQIIYFGAPGTSKSYTLNEDAKKIANQERVTFYPGYSYQQFVGTYKPYMSGDKIAYKFVPGPLLRLLEKALKAEKTAKAKPQEENKADTSAAETSTENQENGQEEKNTEKFLLIVEELNRAEAAAVFGDLFQLLDRDSDGKSEYPISVSEDLKQYLCRKDGNDVGVWANEPEDTQKQLYFPSNFYIWATMNSADQGVFPLDTAFKRRWDFKYFGIDDAEKKLNEDVFSKFWNILRKTINKALLEQLNLNEDKLLGPFFMKVENINEQTFWERFCSKVLLYLYEDAARLNRNRIFQNKITYSQMFDKFAKFSGAGVKWQEDLKKVWNTVFTFDVDLAGDYPWPNAGAELELKADGDEPAGEAGTETENNGATTNEQ